MFAISNIQRTMPKTVRDRKLLMNWTYKTTKKDFDTDEVGMNNHLNNLGDDGWELISIIPPNYEGKFHFFWKKQKVSSPKKAHEAENADTIGSKKNIENEATKNISVSIVENTQSDFEVGDTFPEFSLQSSSGDVYSTADLSKNTIIYFYPADGTEYCTIQAKGFSIIYETITDLGLDIVGVSPDDILTHEKFRSDQNIPFHLLYDKGSKVSGKLGLLKRPPPDHLYPLRVTFLIDKNKVILGKWDEIDVQTHSDDVVSFIVEILEKNEIAK